MPPTPPHADVPDGALTVSELTQEIKTLLQASFSTVRVVGEISDIARPRSGHIYITLKDEGAQIKGVIWRSDVERLKTPLEDGMQVSCTGAVDLYAPRGAYQLMIRRVEPLGEGAMQQALRQLQKKLATEGLFEAVHKQQLPSFPRNVALVTSPSGAAIRDFLEVARRRWSGCCLTVIPCAVQGEAAVSGIVQALADAVRLQPPPDVVVLTRGGGSMEDLWCFNSERVVRAMFACPVPVVSAIGHEIDVTLADMVADVRALTPTEAAELVVPDQAELRERLRILSARIRGAAQTRVARLRERVVSVANRRAIRSPIDRLRDLSRRVDDVEQRIHRSGQIQRDRWQAALAKASGRLEALNPLAVLARGYSYTQLEATGEVVSDLRGLSPGDRVVTTLDAGRFSSTIDEISITHPPSQEASGPEEKR